MQHVECGGAHEKAATSISTRSNSDWSKAREGLKTRGVEWNKGGWFIGLCITACLVLKIWIKATQRSTSTHVQWCRAGCHGLRLKFPSITFICFEEGTCTNFEGQHTPCNKLWSTWQQLKQQQRLVQHLLSTLFLTLAAATLWRNSVQSFGVHQVTAQKEKEGNKLISLKNGGATVALCCIHHGPWVSISLAAFHGPCIFILNVQHLKKGSNPHWIMVQQLLEEKGSWAMITHGFIRQPTPHSRSTKLGSKVPA